jgi:hypothetical protein
MLHILALNIILILGIFPFLLSIWALHRWTRHPRFRDRRFAASNASTNSFRYRSNFNTLYLFDPAYFIGDTSCQFNAHSPLLRCAVNPDGPCQGCHHYESFTHLQSAGHGSNLK